MSQGCWMQPEEDITILLPEYECTQLGSGYCKDTEPFYHSFMYSLVSLLFPVSIHYLQCIHCLIHEVRQRRWQGSGFVSRQSRVRIPSIPFSCCSVLHGYLLLWACRQFVLSACLFQQVDPTNNEQELESDLNSRSATMVRL